MSGREGRSSSLERPLPRGNPGGRTGRSDNMLTRPRCDSAGGWLSWEVKASVKVEVSRSDRWARWPLRSQLQADSCFKGERDKQRSAGAAGGMGHHAGKELDGSLVLKTQGYDLSGP